MFERLRLLRWAMTTKIDPGIKVDSGTASRGAPRWMGENHDAYSKEGFSKNAVVKRCIEMISQGVAAIPLELFKKSTNEEIEDPKHPLLMLMNQPNPFQDKLQFFEELISFFYIDGNTFFNTVAGKDKKIPAELYVKNPKWMKLGISDDGLPRQWVYSNGQDTKTFDINYVTKKSEVFHFKTFNPMDHWVGLSPLRSVADNVDQNNEAGAWNMWMLQNAGMPSGGYETDQTLSKSQYDRIKQQIKANVTGPKNARSSLITDGGLKWVQYGQNAVDMDWLEGTRASARTIAFGLGVPSQLIGIPGDNTYSNLEQADLAFYEKTVIILFNKLIAAINTYLTPSFGEDIELRGNLDEVSALEPRRKEKWEKIKNVDCLTPNEKRVAIGYDKLDDPEADRLWVPAGLVPLDEASDLLEGQEQENDDESSDEEGQDSGVGGTDPDEGEPGKKPKPKDAPGDKPSRPASGKKYIRYRERHKAARI